MKIIIYNFYLFYIMKKHKQLTLIILSLFLLSGYHTKADTLSYRKGTYYMRVTSLQAPFIPLCNPSNATSVLSGTDAFKRMCRFSSVHTITRPFTGFNHTGLGDTLNRYFRIDFADTSVNDEFIDSLLTLTYVEIIEKLPQMQTFGTFTFPNDKSANKQWYLDKVKGFQAHDFSTGSGIIIAVIDDAFDMNHEDLKGSYYINTAEKNGIPGVDDDGNGYVDDITGWDPSDNDNDPHNYETNFNLMKYHGTMVTGVIAATPNNFKGIASIAPDVKIIPIKISSDSFSGNPLTHPLEGLMYAIQSPANIINMSWGGKELEFVANSSLMHMLIILAHNSGKLLVASAGNGHKPLLEQTKCIDIGRGKPKWESYTIDTITYSDSARNYPAAFAEVLSVGATSSNDQKACFSDYGTMSNVDIMAPGETMLTTSPFNNYMTVDGTSFSSPMVAGICALVWSLNSSVPMQTVIDRVKNSADNIKDINENIYDKIGTGRVNALDAVLDKQVKAWFSVDKQSGCNGDLFTFTAKSYSGFTYEWDFGDGTGPQSGTAIQPVNILLPLLADEALVNITLKLKNGSGAVVSTYTRSKYILISKCAANTINNKENQWSFANGCGISFSQGIAKSSTTSIPGTVNFTSIYKTNSTTIKYASSSFGINPQLFNYNGNFNILQIKYNWSGKYFTMYSKDSTYSQGEFFNVDSIRTIFISQYDTNAAYANVGLRYAIIRDSTIANTEYIKDDQRGYVIGGPTIADKTSDGAIRVEGGMAFIPRCDNQIWMILRGRSGAYKDSLLVYLMNTSPTLFSITFQKAYYIPPLERTDYIRANRFGTMIVCASKTDSGIVVYDFKRSTGKLTLRYFIEEFGYSNIQPVFSQKGNILYLAHDQGLRQINLNYRNPKDNIVNLYHDNYFKRISANFNPMYGIQLGPDGRLYTNLPSDMYPNKRLGMMAQPDKFFYSSYGSTKDNYLPLAFLFTGGSNTFYGMAEYQHARECNSLTPEMHSTYVACNTIKLTSTGCTPLKQWNYIYNGMPKSRYADEFLLYLDSFPSTGVSMTMIDGGTSVIRFFQKEVLPPNALTASASSSCDRGVPINYKFTHSVLTQTDIFVREWSVTGGEVHRYLGDSSIDVFWNGEGVQGIVKGVVIHPSSGCRDSVMFTVIKKPPVKIQNYSLLGPWRYDSAIINYNSIFYLTLSDTGYRPTYTSYKWFKDGVQLNFSDTAKRILVIEPGTYRLVADGPCGPDSSNKLVVMVICNTSNDLSNTSIPTATYTGATLTFNGQIDITIPSKVTFTNCTIFMKEASWIELSSFDSLYLINTKVIGCSGWLGIRVLGGGMPRPGSNCGYLSMTASSIENAHIAVSAEAGGEVNTTGSRFLNNGMHIAYDPYIFPNNTFNSNNSFGRLKTISCSGCTHPLTLSLKETNPMVYLEGVKDVSFVISKFEGLNTHSISNLSNIEAQSVDNVDLQNISFYNEADYGIYTKNNINSMISGIEFNDQNKYQPPIHQGAGSIKTGIYAETCQSLTIGPYNSFWCCKTGMEWYATSLNLQSSLFENTFKGCNNGLMFAQQVNPRSNTNLSFNVDTTNTRKLLIECNLFERDSLGMVGSGKLMDQGSGAAGVRNKFVDNINWDIATRNHFNYTYYGTTAYIPNSASGLLKNFVNLNTIPNIDFLSNSGGIVTCANSLFVLKDVSENIEDNNNLPFNVRLFPNPVDKGILTILFTDNPEEAIKLQLYNSIGQKLRSEMLNDKENIMNMQHLPPGVYHINMVSNTFRGAYKLIIK
jgi:hypothetical protein